LKKLASGDGGWQINFTTEWNRFYRVDYAEALCSWRPLQDGILGTGDPATVIDQATAAARYYRVANTGTGYLTPPGMVLIPAGSFWMGDSFTEGEPSELPVHSVDIGAFYMDADLVTTALWQRVRSYALAHGYSFDDSMVIGKGTNHPITLVYWHDALKWCNACSELEGRIPAYYTDASQK
jgi:formylglycine-generating enzyme required for sulfatase activity